MQPSGYRPLLRRRVREGQDSLGADVVDERLPVLAQVPPRGEQSAADARVLGTGCLAEREKVLL